MRKIYFILIAMMTVIAFILPDKVKAGTPGQVSFADSRNVPESDCNYLCAPLTSLDVTVTNGDGVTVCWSCLTWYISVWEWDGSTGYRQIGANQPFSSGPVYTWTGLNWDDSNYPCIVLRWHFVDAGNGCPGFTTNDVIRTFCPPNVPNPLSTSDFYPCQ